MSLLLKPRTLRWRPIKFLKVPQFSEYGRIYKSAIRVVNNKVPSPSSSSGGLPTYDHIFTRARQPREGNRWAERIIISLSLLLMVSPVVLLVKIYDGKTVVTKRRRFLFAPLWVDKMVGEYTLTAMGIEKKDVSQMEGNEIAERLEEIFDHILQSNGIVSDEEGDGSGKDASELAKFAVFDWSLTLVESDDVNALCAPGGRMVFFSGILDKVVSTDDECAAIMCHEIGHAVCRHGVELVQYSLVAIVCLYIVATSFGFDFSAMLDSAIGTAVNLFLELPKSRANELEADEVALNLMHTSGYNIDALVQVLEKLDQHEKQAGAASYPLLSTHPVTAERIKAIKEKVDKIKESKNLKIKND